MLAEGDNVWIQFRLSGTNTQSLFGLTGISMYPMLWAQSGLQLAELVGRLVDEAIARHRDRADLDAGIRSWLAELGA